MEDVTTARDSGPGGTRADARPRARRFGRCRMFKPAQLAFDGSVVDCVLLDISPGGVRVHLREPAEVPDLVTLRLSDGDTFMLRRCWRTGSHMGFEFVGMFPLDVLDGLVSAWVPGTV